MTTIEALAWVLAVLLGGRVILWGARKFHVARRAHRRRVELARPSVLDLSTNPQRHGRRRRWVD